MFTTAYQYQYTQNKQVFLNLFSNFRKYYNGEDIDIADVIDTVGWCHQYGWCALCNNFLAKQTTSVDVLIQPIRKLHTGIAVAAIEECLLFWCRLFYYSKQNYKVRGRRRRNVCPCLECVTDHVNEATHTLVWSRTFYQILGNRVQRFYVILFN